MLLLAALLSVSTSQALVRVQASCITNDGHYRVMVASNEGIGFKRKPTPMKASIQDRRGRVLATYDVELFTGFQPISFGRPEYRDSQSTGDAFSLKGPSTNYKNFMLNAVVNGQTIHDTNLSCSVFWGRDLDAASLATF